MNMILLQVIWPFLQLYSKGGPEKKEVINLDGASVSIVKKKIGSLWKGKNYLEISHPLRPLYRGCKTIFVYYSRRHEMEEWYYRIERAILVREIFCQWSF